MEMKPVKALTGTIKHFPGLYLHILLTEEDGVIVARCLDFSVSSHGENQEDALASLSECITDYLNYAISQGAFDEIIDPDDQYFWNVFRVQKLKEESAIIRKNVSAVKKTGIPEICYA
ncbi:MAG: hypothetical protein AB7S75_00005 [Desulfococcaceae bacterium]